MPAQYVSPAELVKMLEGKTIAKIEYGHYLHWPLTVDEIKFTDGTSIDLSGNADYARIEFLWLTDKTQVVPRFDEEGD